MGMTVVHPSRTIHTNKVFSQYSVSLQSEFLSRTSNKQQIINLISDELMKNGCNVINALRDAEVHVKAAVTSSIHQSTILIREDTDLLMLLLHYAYVDKEMHFRSHDASKIRRVYTIRHRKIILSKEVCSQLLFLLVFTGCDSISRIFSIRRKSSFQKLVKGNPILKSWAGSLILPRQSKEEIADQGATQMLWLHCLEATVNSLPEMWYHVFVSKLVSAKSLVTPERLPPTVFNEISLWGHTIRLWFW